MKMKILTPQWRPIKINKYYPALVLVLLICVSCRKYLEINPPKDKLLTTVVFATNETATAATLNLYRSMHNETLNPYYISFLTGISGDELTTYSTVAQNIYTNSILSNDGSTAYAWNLGYNNIYQCNAIIEGCEASVGLSPDVVKQLVGEATFIRAYWHLFLYCIYGDIPVIITTDYEKNALVKRQPKDVVLKQIIDDLEFAKTQLNENYIGNNSTSISTERIRPNRFAATSLLARAYLYNDEFVKAEEQASLVIANSDSYELIEASKVFLANSREAIFQLRATTPASENTPEGARYILTTSPVTTSGTTISPQLLGAFDSSDLRRVNWIGVYKDSGVIPNKDYYYPAKYKIKSGADFKEYSMVLRFAEQYLIRAEARAQLGKLSDAVDDLDKIRLRAGLTSIKTNNPGIGKDDLLIAIYKERQLELFVEQGHRWFDMKRLKIIDQIMPSVTITKGGPTWNTNKQFWPIPKNEVLNNPNLRQNEGYN